MTRKDFAKVWVGSIVHIDNWAWRVLGIDRESLSLSLAKMPESVYPHDLLWAVSYADVTYVSTQKPPVGHIYGEEEERFWR